MAQQQAGHLTEAAAMYERVVARATEALGKDHLYTGVFLGRLAGVNYEAKQYDQAISHYRQALAILRQHLSPDHNDVTFAVNELARALSNAKRYEEAARLNTENLKVREAKYGKNHPSTLLSLHNLGIDYSRMRRWAEAVPILESWLERSGRAQAEKTPYFSESLEYLAEGHVALGHLDQGEKYYLQALAFVDAGTEKGSGSPGANS